jgi:hypothetical protein
MVVKKILPILIAVLMLSGSMVFAEQFIYSIDLSKKDKSEPYKGDTYSPYAKRNFPEKPLWGDTHLHTALSLDARAAGVLLTPEDAYRFARGEEVVSSHGLPVKLSRPLDWLVVTDHSDAMGAMMEVVAGNPELMKDPTLKKWNAGINKGGEKSVETVLEIIDALSSGNLPEPLKDEEFFMNVWTDYTATADKYDDPGKFSAIIGYEWTSNPGGNNLHRNVIYRDGAEKANQVLPYTTVDSENPEDLWKWLENYEKTTGGQVLALAHNGNVSNGIMFPEINHVTGKPLTKDYVQTRIRWEPIYEVTQIKGDGEAHPYLSPNDEFADYETWDISNLGPTPKEESMLQYEYAREALKRGLKFEKDLGTNPYKFGMVGSTDAHTGLATAEEDNFFGKISTSEPNPERISTDIAHFDTISWPGWFQVSSGYAAVWATENTRDAIFDAMKRKEVYASTGPRIDLRFFGGWDFVPEDVNERLPANVGYTKGVPMGGDLTNAPKGKSPNFLIAARKDPYSGNLDRIQVVKGWLDKDGKTHEKVYDVVWSGDRNPGKDGKLPPVGNTVDVKNATWTNTIGEPELLAVWTDPDFDSKQRAFYYTRVIEIPTPRWTAYEAKRFSVEADKKVPMITQERAYSSPIWYTP